MGRDLAPRLSRRLGVGLTADCTELAIDPEDGLLFQTRPAFGGNIMARILNTEFHTILYAASKSEHLLRILQNLRDYFYRYRKIILKTKSNLEDSLKNHEMMIQKMKAGDRKAVEHLVNEHVKKALKALKEEIMIRGLAQ